MAQSRGTHDNDSGSPPTSSGGPDLARGAMVGRYVVLKQVGRGGMGVVYLAVDGELERRVAIKMLRAEATTARSAGETRTRLLREAQAMAKVSHPNVVAVYDVGTFGEEVFVAMEYVQGETLREWRASKKPRAAEILGAYAQAGRGLDAAHEAGVLHRDFKPENALVGEHGRVKVLDFGLARFAEDAARDAQSAGELALGDTGIDLGRGPATPLTLHGTLLGTPAYMAPEQLVGEPATAKSDQFAFGVALYEALYNELPFEGKTLSSLTASIHAGKIRSPSSDARVPARVRRVLLRALSAAPERRYESVGDLLAALDRARGSTTRRISAGVAVAALALCGATLAWARRSGECAPDPADLRGVWDDGARAALVTDFDRSGVPNASEIAARVVRILDETTAKWTSMKSESCEATRVRHRQPEDAYRLRADCLDRRREELRELVTSLRTSDPAIVEKGTSAAYGLTNVAVCGDVPMLRTSGGLPDDPEARRRVAFARAAFARAHSAQLVGKLDEAEREAHEALDLAHASAHPATIAEASRTLGGIEIEKNEYAKAEATLSEGTWSAAKVGADALVVDSASMLAFDVGSKLGKPGEARMWLAIAESALARVGISQDLELSFLEHKAWLLNDAEGRAEETIPILERVAQTYESIYGVHPRTVRALYNLGDAETSVGDHARACQTYERALTMAETVGGPLSEWVGYSAEGRADCLAAAGDYAQSDRVLERARGIFVANKDYYSEVEALEVGIRSSLARGDFARAVDASRRALSLTAQLDGTASLVELVYAPAGRALLHAPAGSTPGPSDAEGLCTQADKQQEILGLLDPTKILRADALLCLGEARLAAGRPADAIVPLERSLSITKRTYPADLARVRFALARALAASGGDVARAKALAVQARDEFAAAPGLAYERDVVKEWLGSRM